MDFYLSNLPGEIKEDYLRNIFCNVGAVRSIRYIPESARNTKVLAIIRLENKNNIPDRH